MKQAWRIYMSDLKHLTINWAASILALGLIVLPSLYAWINVEASIDPYAHTEDLPVGVVNEDRGAELAGHRFHAGDEIVKTVNYPPPTLRLEVGASSDLCVFAER